MALSNNGRRWPLLLSVAGAAGLGVGGVALAQQRASSQADAGRAAYAQNCAACHGTELTNGEFAPALKGAPFLARWGGQPVTELLQYIHSSMPPSNPGGLDDNTYAALAAFIAEQNGGAEGAPARLPAAPPQAQRGQSAVGGLS